MDSLERARELLPGWVAWAGPAAFLLAAVTLAAITLPIWAYTLGSAARAAAKRAGESGGELHWTERARLTWNGRRLFFVLAVVEIGALAVLARFWIGPFAYFRGALSGLPVALAAGLVALEVHRRWLLPVAIGRRPSFGQALLGVMARGFWVTPVVPLLVVLFSAPESLVSWQTLFWLVALTLLMVSSHLGFWLQVARVCGGARVAPARVTGVAAELAERQGVSLKHVLVVRWWHCNALAVPLRGIVAVTDRALEVLSAAELRAILAHEVAHLAEAPEIKRGRLLRSLLVPLLASLLLLAVRYELGALLPLAAFVWFLMRWLRNWVRTQEAHADANAADEECYAQALEALYRANGTPAVLRRQGTHPHLYDRLLAAGRTPDYPRPEPPASSFGALAVILVFSLLATIAGANILYEAPQGWLGPERAAVWRLSAGSVGADSDLASIASIRIRNGDPSGDVLYDAAEDLAQRPSFIVSRRVSELAAVGRCEDARAHFTRIEPEFSAQQLRSERLRRVQQALEKCER